MVVCTSCTLTVFLVYRRGLSLSGKFSLSNVYKLLQQLEGTRCKRFLLAEDPNGILIQPFSKWTLRTEAYEDAKFDFLVTEFGNPAHDELIWLRHCLGVFTEGPGFVGTPTLTWPAHITTNGSGLATVTITTRDPGKPRYYIDGQLYSYCYHTKRSSRLPDPKGLDNVIIVRLYETYPNVRCPTWLEHIYPIFKQYAELYPVMTENFVDLGNYYDVRAKKVAIMKTMELPMNHPNHMPVTRDLSHPKRHVILKWLKTGLHVGDWRKNYTLDHLKNDLQTALQIEHATIPPYLTALATIKNAYNLEVQAVFKTVLLQEMLHLSLVANIINAIGGKPKLHFDGFIPEYPSHLPGGVHPGLRVPIEKCSLPLIRNVFMKIEEPMDLDLQEGPVNRISNLTESPKFSQIDGCPSYNYSCHFFRRTNRLSTSKMGRAGEYQTSGNFGNILPYFVHPSNGVGAFYDNIRCGLKYLNDSNCIFTGTLNKMHHTSAKSAQFSVIIILLAGAAGHRGNTLFCVRSPRF